MEMFVLSYVNVYPKLCLQVRFCLRLRTNNGSTNQYFTLKNVFPIYVSETMYLLGNLPFFKIHVNRFMAWDDSPGAKIISKYILCVRGLVPFSDFWDIPFINRLLVTSPLEKERATHFVTLAWKIPGTEEPSGLLSMELHRVKHKWLKQLKRLNSSSSTT